MTKNLKLLNTFKYDKVIWGIVAAISAVIIFCSGNWLTGLAYAIVGVVATVMVAHVGIKNIQITTLPLIALVVILLLVSLLLASDDGRWLSLSVFTVDPLWFAPVAVCLLLTTVTFLKDDMQKVVGLCVLAVICSLCIALDIFYAFFLIAMAIIGLLILGIYRKAVLFTVGAIVVADMLVIGMVFFTGKTTEERMATGDMRNRVEQVSTIQKRIDHWKEYLVNGGVPCKTDDVSAVFADDMTKSKPSNILARTYHNIYNHAGTFGCIGFLILYLALFCRVIDRIASSKSRYAKYLALCCSLALISDSLYSACMAKYICQHPATSAIMEYVMFGVILSCLSTCDARTNNGVKGFFRRMF